MSLTNADMNMIRRWVLDDIWECLRKAEQNAMHCTDPGESPVALDMVNSILQAITQKLETLGAQSDRIHEQNQNNQPQRIQGPGPGDSLA